MMTPVKVFYIEPTDRQRQWLRRFTHGNDRKCAANQYGCNAMFEIGEADILYTSDGFIDGDRRDRMPPKTDPRWPKVCEACGAPFEAKDKYQVHGKTIYVRPDNGDRYTLREAPVGACWDAHWVRMRSGRRQETTPGVGTMIGPDGRSLVVKCPDGSEWMIDSRASNCTLPADNTHHCWVRTGRPEDGTLHVDKNGNTCQAGAGSIQTAKWHGFLHHGELHE